MFIFRKCYYPKTPGVAPYVYYIKENRFYISRIDNRSREDRLSVPDAIELTVDQMQNHLARRRLPAMVDVCKVCGFKLMQHHNILHEFEF